MLPFALLVSFIYDIIFLLFLDKSISASFRKDSPAESKVKHFAMHISYVVMIFKPFAFFVLWKVAINYLTDIKQVDKASRYVQLVKVLKEYGPPRLQRMEFRSTAAHTVNHLGDLEASDGLYKYQSNPFSDMMS